MCWRAPEMDRPCRDGGDRAERQKSALLLLLLGRLLLLRHSVTPLPHPRVPRLARSFATLRGARERCQEENTLCRGWWRPMALYLGGSRPRTGLVLLAHRRGPAVLAASDEFLVERHALLAHRALVGRIRREIAAHETEDFLAGDLGLLGAPP